MDDHFAEIFKIDVANRSRAHRELAQRICEQGFDRLYEVPSLVGGGRSGALVYRIRTKLKSDFIREGGFNPQEFEFILKFDSAKGAIDESSNVASVRQKHPDFADKHIPKALGCCVSMDGSLVFNAKNESGVDPERGGAVLYQLAGGTTRFESLAELTRKDRGFDWEKAMQRITEVIFSVNDDRILSESRSESVYPGELVKRALDHPFPRTSNSTFEVFLGRDCNANNDPRESRAWKWSFRDEDSTREVILPNPWFYLQKKNLDRWHHDRLVASTGFFHGDLHMGNVMLNPDRARLDEFFLIDLADAGHDDEQAILFDNAYLELSYLLRTTEKPLGEGAFYEIWRAINRIIDDPDVHHQPLSEGLEPTYDLLASAHKVVRPWVMSIMKRFGAGDENTPPASTVLSLMKDQWRLGMVYAGMNFAFKSKANPQTKFLGFLWASLSLKAFMKSDDKEPEMVLTSPQLAEDMMIQTLNEFYEWRKKEDELSELDRKILESWRPPTFVRRRDLDGRIWKDKAFQIVTLFNHDNVKLYKDSEKSFHFEVDLTGQTHGIYNNSGKGFLRDKYRDRFAPQLRKCDADAQDFLMGKINHFEFSSSYPEGCPFRWASAGYLARVKLDGRRYVMLFFRDIHPVGWNVANGASENEEECVNLTKIVEREFEEETVVVRGDPREYVDQSALGHPSKDRILRRVRLEIVGRESSGIRPARWQVSAHRQLRMQAPSAGGDGITVDFEDELEDGEGPRPEPIEVTEVGSPQFRISVKDKDRPPFKGTGWIYTVNPFEFGTEAIRLCDFELPKGTYVLDGEVNDMGTRLTRRPVTLIDYDWLRRVILDEALLPPPQGREFEGCKTLPVPIPKGKYHLFDWDLEKRTKEPLYGWFEEARLGNDITSPELLTLNPVTWKTLQLAFAYDAWKNS